MNFAPTLAKIGLIFRISGLKQFFNRKKCREPVAAQSFVLGKFKREDYSARRVKRLKAVTVSSLSADLRYSDTVILLSWIYS